VLKLRNWKTIQRFEREQVALCCHSIIFQWFVKLSYSSGSQQNVIFFSLKRTTRPGV